MLSGYLENTFAWGCLLQNVLIHVSGKIVVAEPTFLRPTELLLAGFFNIFLFGVFLSGSPMINRFGKRETSIIEDQLREPRIAEA